MQIFPISHSCRILNLLTFIFCTQHTTNPAIGEMKNRSVTHDDIIKCKHFARYWPCVRGIYRSPVTQRPVTRSFDVFFGLPLNRRLSKQWRGWWFETPLCPLWRHSNAYRPLDDSNAWLLKHHLRVTDPLCMQSTLANVGIPHTTQVAGKVFLCHDVISQVQWA